MKPVFTSLPLLLLSTLVCFAQEKAPETAPVRTSADGPFVPAPALPGGIVLPLYPPDSPKLNHERIHEAERYNTAGKATGKLLNTLNIHNPTIEAHLAPADGPNTGAAVIVAPVAPHGSGDGRLRVLHADRDHPLQRLHEQAHDEGGALILEPTHPIAMRAFVHQM